MKENEFTHLGLFEGIGGFSLAARWAGWETVAYCEINSFCLKILKYHFQEADVLTDINTTDFKKYANRIDILTGGFPCQPYSIAGKRKGKEDERHLWPEMLRAIREIRPVYVVGENVFGLINWDGGLVFNEVQADLEAEGYEVFPYVLPACAVNAPHRRDRVWFVAYSVSNRHNRVYDTSRGIMEREQSEDSIETGNGGTSEISGSGTEQVIAKSCGAFENTNGNGWTSFERQKKSGIRQLGNISAGDNERIQADNGEVGVVTNPAGIGLQHSGRTRSGRTGFEDNNSKDASYTSSRWVQNNKKQQAGKFKQDIPGFRGFPTQSPVCNGDDGLSGRLDSITFPKWRSESIKAGGNAIVPQVALQIFKAINTMENRLTPHLTTD